MIAGTIALVEAVIGLRKHWVDAHIHEETAKTEIVQQQLKQRIYERALAATIPDDVVELAVRTALPAAKELTSDAAAQFELEETHE